MENMKKTKVNRNKLELLDPNPLVIDFLQKNTLIKDYVDNSENRHLKRKRNIVIKSIIAIGEGGIVFRGFDHQPESIARMDRLIDALWEIETFYEFLGGITGYHEKVLDLINEKEEKNESINYLHPISYDLTKSKEENNLYIESAIESLYTIAMVFPIGGAGDRLNLIDESTGEPLPAAALNFCGRSLLEVLIRDLVAWELLYEKKYNKKIVTPIVFMTSHEKNNDTHIRQICEKNNWFGRGIDNFFFIIQPLVPVVTKDGHWSLTDTLTLNLKPGGHGVIWKLAKDQGAFEWMQKKWRRKILVRQINNPIAGIDDGLLAFLGIGLQQKKKFGFASCPRVVNASEGTIVVRESVYKSEEVDESNRENEVNKVNQKGASAKKKSLDYINCYRITKGFNYTLSNIEYTDFKKNGIVDVPESDGSPYSIYPANTNILFADLELLECLTKKCPVPGLLINMKSDTTFIDENGVRSTIKGGRLESTMQNISDYLNYRSRDRLKLSNFKNLIFYITNNIRRKTISVTKRSYDFTKLKELKELKESKDSKELKGSSESKESSKLMNSMMSIRETPEGAFYDLLKNHEELLASICGMSLPLIGSEEDYLRHGPGFICDYHPALGPMYSLIKGKIIGGKMGEGSELKLEISELVYERVDLDGSLSIEGEIGKSRCVLRDVKISNLGIDHEAENIYWKDQIKRREQLRIVIHGSGVFMAEGVTFTGDQFFEVFDGECVELVGV